MEKWRNWNFISNITENRAESKDLSVQVIKAKEITCSFDMSTGVLWQRNLFDLYVNTTQDIKEKAAHPENGFTYLMNMTKTGNILPKPRFASFSFDFR